VVVAAAVEVVVVVVIIVAAAAAVVVLVVTVIIVVAVAAAAVAVAVIVAAVLVAKAAAAESAAAAVLVVVVVLAAAAAVVVVAAAAAAVVIVVLFSGRPPYSITPPPVCQVQPSHFDGVSDCDSSRKVVRQPTRRPRGARRAGQVLSSLHQMGLPQRARGTHLDMNTTHLETSNTFSICIMICVSEISITTTSASRRESASVSTPNGPTSTS